MSTSPRHAARGRAVAGLGVCAVLVTGCGGSSSTSSSTSTSTSTSTSPSDTTPTGTASASAGSTRTPGAASTTASGLHFTRVYAFSPATGMDMGAAYATIENPTGTADALVGASTPDAGEAMVHRTVSTGSGAGTMQHVASLPLPAHGTLTLQPGGNHIMLMGLHRALEAGHTMPLTLRFRSGRTVTLQVPVIDREQRP